MTSGGRHGTLLRIVVHASAERASLGSNKDYLSRELLWAFVAGPAGTRALVPADLEISALMKAIKRESSQRRGNSSTAVGGGHWNVGNAEAVPLV